MTQVAVQKIIDKYFKDKKGRVVLAEKPNLPIIVWFVTMILGKFFNGIFGEVLHIVAFGSIFMWAWLELFEGTNYFRRTLGLIVLIAVIWNQVN